MVLDAQVVADNANLEEAHQKKVKYYNTQELAEAVQAKLGVSDPVQFSSITLNWRGVWSRSAVDTRKKLELSDRQLANISLRVIQGTHTIFKWFRSSTVQTTSRPGRKTRRMTGQPPRCEVDRKSGTRYPRV